MLPLFNIIWAVCSQPYCECDSFMHRHLQPWLRMRIRTKCLVYGTDSLLGPIAPSRSLTRANSYLLMTQLNVCLRRRSRPIYLRRSTRSSVSVGQDERRRNFGKNILVKFVTTPVEFTSSLRRTSGWCDQQTDKWHSLPGPHLHAVTGVRERRIVTTRLGRQLQWISAVKLKDDWSGDSGT